VSFFFSSRRRHTRFSRDWSSDVCSSDLATVNVDGRLRPGVVALPHGHIELPVNDLTSPRSTNPATGMPAYAAVPVRLIKRGAGQDRKSTRLNSSHVKISYAVFCLKKKKE